MDEKFDRNTALSVLRDLSENLCQEIDIFGYKRLSISVDKFEAIRKKYLDNKKGEINNGAGKEMR